MTRRISAVALGATLLAAPALAFDGWYYYCPPRPYCPPPVIYYYPPVFVAPFACPPGQPATPPADGVIPKTMPAPKPAGKEEKSKSGVAPVEFKEAPKTASEPAPFPKTTTDLAVPTPAPPPTEEKKLELNIPVPEKKIEPASPEKKTDVPAPKIEIPPVKTEPTLELPKVPAPEVGANEVGKIPALTLPTDPPKSDGGLKIPDVPAPSSGSGALPASGLPLIPPLDLPPAKTPEKKSTSGSSPLSNVAVPLSISVKAVSGSVPVSGRYTVRFFNYTNADFKLTVESGSITLPKKHFVDVEIGRSFNWKAGEGPSRKAEIPTDAAGLEIAVKP